MGANNQLPTMLEERFFCIPIRIPATGTLAAGSSTTVTRTIGSLPLRWEQLGGTWSGGDMEIRITDDGADKSFMPDRISVEALLGSTEREPYQLDHPWVFQGGSSITVEVANVHASEAGSLRLVFVGQRLMGM